MGESEVLFVLVVAVVSLTGKAGFLLLVSETILVVALHMFSVLVTGQTRAGRKNNSWSGADVCGTKPLVIKTNCYKSHGLGIG